jgi:5-methylcytosine-specific restriction endonuclease McrA
MRPRRHKNTHRCGLRRAVSPWQLEFNYAVPTAPPTAQKPAECIPFDGPETKWRERAVTRCWIELGIDHARLGWPTPQCVTPLCMNLEHLAWEAPTKLEYPDGICVYCGVIAGTKDHLLPRTWTGEAIRKNVLTVPACGECNSAIGDRYAPIFKRKRRIINIPPWSKAEIAEMGHTLRSSIEKGLHDQKLTLARLAWPDDPDYDLRAMQLSGIENPYEAGILDEPEVVAA